MFQIYCLQFRTNVGVGDDDDIYFDDDDNINCDTNYITNSKAGTTIMNNGNNIPGDNKYNDNDENHKSSSNDENSNNDYNHDYDTDNIDKDTDVMIIMKKITECAPLCNHCFLVLL